MLGAAFCILFGYAAAQEYYLGDSITVTVDAKMFDPLAFRVDANITSFYMEFPGNSGANTIHFANPKSVFVVDAQKQNVVLSCDFGTIQQILALPTYVTSLANSIRIVAQAAVIRPGKAPVMKTARVFTGKFGRHLSIKMNRGVVATQSTLPTKFQVGLSGYMTPPHGSLFVVQLVTKTTTKLDLYDSMTVTNVTTSGSTMVTVEGTWNKKGPVPKTGLRLLVGVKNGTILNTYSVVNDDVMTDMSSFVLVGNSFAVKAPMTVPEYNVTSITVNGGGVSSFWWLLATNAKTNATYALNCVSQMDANFSNFEWYVQSIPTNTTKYPNLPEGTYDLSVVWTPTVTSNADAGVNYPRSGKAATMTVTGHGGTAPTPITFNRNSGQQLGDITEGSKVSVDVYSLFSKIQLQWFKQAPSNNYTNSSNGNGTKGYEAIPGTKKSFDMIPGQTKSLTMTVPNGFNLSSSFVKVRLYGWTEDCNMNHFGQVFVSGNVTNPAPSPTQGPSSTSNALGPGAIVGIVCAVVFVCGVAAWWLCMKKPGNQDRYQKLEK